MARVKQAVMIIRNEIEKMTFTEEDQFIRGMVNMAERLDKITHAEATALLRELDDKYFSL
jgi:hypothetical protein